MEIDTYIPVGFRLRRGGWADACSRRGWFQSTHPAFRGGREVSGGLWLGQGGTIGGSGGRGRGSVASSRRSKIPPESPPTRCSLSGVHGAHRLTFGPARGWETQKSARTVGLSRRPQGQSRTIVLPDAKGQGRRVVGQSGGRGPAKCRWVRERELMPDRRAIGLQDGGPPHTFLARTCPNGNAMFLDKRRPSEVLMR